MRRLFYWSGLLAAALILRGAVFSSANPEGGPAPEPKEEHGFLSDDFLKKLTDRLKLTPEQQKKVKSVLDASRPDMEKARAEMKAARERMRALAHKTKEGIRETLDMGQKDRFDEMFVRMKRRVLKGISGRRGHGHEKEIEIREIRRSGGEAHEGPEGPDGPPPPPEKDDEDDD